MQENNHLQLFDIKPIMSNVEKVIQKGLNKLLVNYIDRHEMLEKTHKQLIQLPSIAQEINNRKIQTEITDTHSETDIDNYGNSDFSSIKDMTENIIRDQFFQLENKLNKMEKKYDEIIPILDKLLTKITHLNDDIKNTSLLFIIYLLWIHLNQLTITDAITSTKNLVLYNKNGLPGMTILQKFLKIFTYNK